MKAMVATQWGEPSELEYLDVPDPEPGPGQVLVETRAAGCNFPDILMIQGKYQVKPPHPFSPGHEIAGVVRAVGPGVTRVRPGQRVIANLEWGGYAEQAVAAAERVHPIPDAMPFDQAAAFFVVYQTGLLALWSGARPSSRASGSWSTARRAAWDSRRSSSARRSAPASSPPPARPRSSRSPGSREPTSSSTTGRRTGSSA